MASRAPSSMVSRLIEAKIRPLVQLEPRLLGRVPDQPGDLLGQVGQVDEAARRRGRPLAADPERVVHQRVAEEGPGGARQAARYACREQAISRRVERQRAQVSGRPALDDRFPGHQPLIVADLEVRDVDRHALEPEHGLGRPEAERDHGARPGLLDGGGDARPEAAIVDGHADPAHPLTGDDASVEGLDGSSAGLSDRPP